MEEAIQMPALLQAALFLASLAVIVLVACLIPIAFQARRHIAQLAITAGQLKSDLGVLVQDSRELVRNVNALTTRANEQIDELGQVVGTVRQWTQHADRFVSGVGMAIELPAFSLLRNMNLVRTGVTTFLRTLLGRNHYDQTQDQTRNRTTEENDHV